MDTSPQPAPPPSPSDNKLTSDKYAEFVEALDVLYIRNNISGRNQFAAAWPEAAQHIFGEDLMRFDREGTQDRERRAALETEADDRRIELFEIASTLQEKSVDKGVLQIEYVQNLVNRLGRRLALSLYARWLVDRFIPPPPEEMPQPAPEIAAPPPKKAERPSVGVRPIDMDNVRPIEVEPEMGPPPEEELIVETQGASHFEIAPQQQESMAPVFGQKKPVGLKILSIAEEEPSQAAQEQPPQQNPELPKAPEPQPEDEEEDPPLFPEPINPQRDENNN